MTSSSARTRTEPDAGRLVPVLAAVVLIAVASWRATLGITLLDDTHLVMLSVRLASGATPFVDEMTLHQFGALPTLPFTWLWLALTGSSGIVLSLRVFHIALAAACGLIIYRSLSPWLDRSTAFAAAALPALAPPYNIIGTNWNTAGALAAALALSLAFDAALSVRTRTAFFAGVAMAATAVFYAPLAPAVVVLGVVFALVVRTREPVLACIGGGVAVAAVFTVWLLAGPGIESLRHSLEYTSATWGEFTPAGDRLADLSFNLSTTFVQPRLIPLWIASVAAALPWTPHLFRLLAAAAIPLLAAVPAAVGIGLEAPETVYGGIGATYLLLLALACAAPVASYLVQYRDRAVFLLLSLGALSGLAGFLLVSISTSSGWERGVAIVGATPLVIALLAGWTRSISREHPLAGSAAVAMVAAILCVLLFSSSFKDDPPLTLDARITHGPFAGISTTPERVAEFATIEQAALRWVGADDGVLVVNNPGAYLLLPGTPATNSLWMDIGPATAYTVEYFEQTASPPDVAFVNTALVSGEASPAAARDSLMHYLYRGYEILDEAGPFTVFVRR